MPTTSHATLVSMVGAGYWQRSGASLAVLGAGDNDAVVAPCRLAR